MNAGPQIMSAIIFVTANKPLRLSSYFLTGVVIAVTAGVTITYALANLLDGSVSLGKSSDSGSIGNIIQYVLVGLHGARVKGAHPNSRYRPAEGEPQSRLKLGATDLGY